MSGVVANPPVLFFTLFVGLIVVVESGAQLRQWSHAADEAYQSLVESARDGLMVLLGFLLGFALPMALPHYEERRRLVIHEAQAIGTVEQRAQLLPRPFNDRIRGTLREYVDSRLQFAGEDDERRVREEAARADELQGEMWKAAAEATADGHLTVMSPMIAKSIGDLSDVAEQQLAAYELRIPDAVWGVLILVSALTCLVVGYSMRRRSFVAVLVLPLTIAVVLSLTSELDIPRTGLIRVSQESMLRLQRSLMTAAVPRPDARPRTPADLPPRPQHESWRDASAPPATFPW